MTHNPEQPAPPAKPRKVRRGWWWKIAAVLLIVGIGTAIVRGKGENESIGMTFEVKRGLLPIAVLERGNIEALESQTIKSEVKMKTKIMSVIEEGYLVTQEDVDNKKILVELNASELQDKLTQQEIEVQNAFSEYTDAREQYEIQVKQNESDIKAAELEAKFKRMDFEKYLGKELVQKIIGELGITELEREARVDLNELYAEIRKNAAESGVSPETKTGEPSAESEPPADGEEAAQNTTTQNGQDNTLIQLALQVDKTAAPSIDFSEYAKPELLQDGDSAQKLRQMEDDLLIAKNELSQAQSQLEGTERLAEKGFVTQNDLEKDKINLDRCRIKVESSDTARSLFIKYEFPKEAEKLLSEYQEALRKLVRTKKQALSKLSQAETNMLARKIQFELKRKQRDEITDQIAKCKIAAEKIGLVVYGANNRRPWDNQPRIEAGSEVWEGFQILSIPDMSAMSAKVNIHESNIKKIQKGQKARVTLEAFPSRVLTGEVTKVALLPDSSGWWGNDQKMYPVTVQIEGAYDWLKPGMTAKIEILVDEVQDTLYIPLQAVYAEGKERVCYRVTALGARERCVVETGQLNDKFIEIKAGLDEGDSVLLRAPEAGKKDEKDAKNGAEEPTEEATEEPAEAAVEG